jgi:Tol biopolymer transport system component
MEAEENYRAPSVKARRVLVGGFGAQWSPDGKKLAFSLGVQGYSGVALYDPAAKETELPIVPGKDPRWSPDGRYIAFVRDCQALRLEELTTSERKEQTRRARDEEVWVMHADGTESRRLARGGWPSWGQDSAHIYFQSRLDEALCSIPIAGPDVEAKRIMSCPSLFPSVSPDNERVAYLESTSLKVKDLASQALVAERPAPLAVWDRVSWSFTGRELCLAGRNDSDDRMGLWIYNLDTNKPARILDGQITVGSWASDGTKLLFSLGPPYFEIWAAELDPNVATIEALGSGRTLNQHFREMLAFYTRRIEADPNDAYAYSRRAQCQDCLGDRAMAALDMRRWSAVMGGTTSSDVPSATSRNSRRAINLPFDCEFVFSAERPVNAIPMMSIAFGQKGRCEMKLFEMPMFVASLLGFCVVSGLDSQPAHANFTFGEPVNLRSVIPVIDPARETIDCFSSDGLEMYISSQNPAGGYGDWDLWVLKRPSKDADWGPPENLGPAINSPSQDSLSCISNDGLTLYFGSNRPERYGNFDIYMTTRATKNDPWGPAANMGTNINSSATDGEPSISSDGLEFYFESFRDGGYGGADIYVAKRATENDPWGAPVNLGPVVNTPYREQWLSLSPDGLLLLFSDHTNASSFLPGGYGQADMWTTRRASRADPWQAPVNLGPKLNSSLHDGTPRISPDGSTLYFFSSREGSWNNYQASILPIADFTGDGKVDAVDMTVLVDNWGKSDSVCDIGPFAWGGGVVDEKDLKVFMKSVMTPAPDASDVLYDTILSWISPSFATACDVYLGTSREAVTNASRENPLGVLVSQSQTTTTYDPAAPLELTETYYWRVDFVIAGSTPTIIKGLVLQFTTAALTYRVKNIAATASSAQAGSGPEKTVDGSGFDKSDGHSTDVKDMWWTLPTPAHWIQYEFDKVCTLHEMWVWNMNQIIEPIIGFGAKAVTIEYSTDGTTWTALANVPEFAQAPGKAGYTANTIVSFAGVPARYVKLTIEKNWGVTPQTGLSEVRFFCIQTAAVPQP